jgi:Mannosyl-glycoprotein endo-beta-N-acetylglucosaminidase
MESNVLSRSGSRARRRRARTVLAFACVFSAISIALLALTPAASSQEDREVTGVRERFARAQADAAAAQGRYDQAVAEREQAQVQISNLEQTIASTRTQEAALRSENTRRAVALYKNSDASGLQALDTEDPLEPGRRTKFTEFADEFYEERAQELHEEADLQQQSHNDLQRRRAELDDAVPRLEQEKAAADQKVAKASRGLEIAEKLAPMRAMGQPVMGPSVLSAAEMAAWFRTSGSSPRLSAGMSIEQLAQMFVDEGTAENVRGDFAFAQAYIETGGFSAGGSDNNFSGLGACDGCAGQNRFPTALDGIRAQIQFLRSYADGGSRAAGLANPPSPYWFGLDPVTAASTFDNFSGKGSAPTWRMMGGGKWATDPSYASKVIGVYDRMIAAAGG